MDDKGLRPGATLYKNPSKAEIFKIINKYVAEVSRLGIVSGLLIGTEEEYRDYKGRGRVYIWNIFDKEYFIEDFYKDIFINLSILCGELKHQFSLMRCADLLKIGHINPSRIPEREEYCRELGIKLKHLKI